MYTNPNERAAAAERQAASRQAQTKKQLEVALNNPIFRSVRGSLGGFTLRTDTEGKVHVQDRPGPRTAPLTALQKKHQKRFNRACAYVKAALADPEKRAIYEAVAARGHISVHNAAMQDYMTPPVIMEIDPADYSGRAHEHIRMQVDDTADAARVRVVIRDCVGSVVEQGPAVRTASGLNFRYRTRKDVELVQTVRIEVIATDLAGNQDRKTIPCAVRGIPATAKPWCAEI